VLPYQVSMGIYVYEERALRYLPESGPCQFPELVLRLVAAGERVAAYHSAAAWYDIGTLAEYERASRDFELAPEKFAVAAVAAPATSGNGNGFTADTYPLGLT
jgi:NDP-sugar pyrophosphorylase family protein